MKLMEQLFSKGLELKSEEDKISFRLKKQPTQMDYNDMAILAGKDSEDFIGSSPLQAQLAIHVANIESYKFNDEEVDLEIEGFYAMQTAIRNIFFIIRYQLRDLKKKL